MTMKTARVAASMLSLHALHLARGALGQLFSCRPNACSVVTVIVAMANINVCF